MTQADWQPSATMAMLSKRAELLASARRFFAGHNILEVETPIICGHGVTEPHINNLPLRFAGTTAWLRSSPEYHMKRLLAAGSGDIYQIGKVFRGGEAGQRHQPEFTMIEWYRLGLHLDEMIAHTCELITILAEQCGYPLQRYRRISYQTAFNDACGLDPHSASTASLRRRALESTATSCDVDLALQLGENRDGWLDYLASQVVYPSLSSETLWVIDSFPASQAQLAQINPTNPQVADRYEIFLDGIELANGYNELRDANEQYRRFVADQAARASNGLESMTKDKRLLAALASGLPECCGVAVGLDRILLAAGRQPNLSATMSFSPGA